jgi:hypothetical protein
VDLLTAFGVGSLTAMMIAYTLESRSRWWTLAFAFACWSAALYGWLAGAWPFTVVEVLWGVIALRKFMRAR